MIHLRKLRQEDAPLMLEWMHDEDVVYFMKADFQHKTNQDCENFITSAQDESKDLHLAVADDNDTYMGTVSLKDIENNSAEFAITMRKAAMGKGYAAEGMKQIIDKGFNKFQLNHIYWCVNPANKRAVRFYDKNGYHRVVFDVLCKTINISETGLENRGGTDQKKQQNTSGIWFKGTEQQRSRKPKSHKTIEYGLSFYSGTEVYGGVR